jgi:hypothetical protein
MLARLLALLVSYFVRDWFLPPAVVHAFGVLLWQWCLATTLRALFVS